MVVGEGLDVRCRGRANGRPGDRRFASCLQIGFHILSRSACIPISFYVGEALLEHLAVALRHGDLTFPGGDPIPEALHVVDLLIDRSSNPVTLMDTVAPNCQWG